MFKWMEIARRTPPLTAENISTKASFYDDKVVGTYGDYGYVDYS